MSESQMGNLVYLLILLIVILTFTLGGYRGDVRQAVKHAAIWLAIISGLFVVVRLFGY